MLNHLFHLSPDSESSLQQQVREQISAAILDGHIPVDTPLPSTRKLAEILSVSRNTVILAYQQLMDDGYLVSRERAGFYVNEDILKGNIRDEIKVCAEPSSAPDWGRHLKSRPTLRKLNKVQNWHAYPYPFIYGQLDPAMFPTNHWRECSRDAGSVQAIRDWACDSYDDDDPLLIEQIHSRILPRRGVWADPEEILVTVGAQHALYMVLRLLLNTGTNMGLEEPGYPDVKRIADCTGTMTKALRVDQDGLVVDGQLDDCDVVFATPSHHFPTTVTMPLDRRVALLDKAAEKDFLIIEDDYECETSFAEKPTACIKKSGSQRSSYLSG